MNVALSSHTAFSIGSILQKGSIPTTDIQFNYTGNEYNNFVWETLKKEHDLLRKVHYPELAVSDKNVLRQPHPILTKIRKSLPKDYHYLSQKIEYSVKVPSDFFKALSTHWNNFATGKFQDSSLYSPDSIFSNLLFGFKNADLSSDIVKNKMLTISSWLESGNNIPKMPTYFIGGILNLIGMVKDPKKTTSKKEKIIKIIKNTGELTKNAGMLGEKVLLQSAAAYMTTNSFMQASDAAMYSKYFEFLGLTGAVLGSSFLIWDVFHEKKKLQNNPEAVEKNKEKNKKLSNKIATSAFKISDAAAKMIVSSVAIYQASLLTEHTEIFSTLRGSFNIPDLPTPFGAIPKELVIGGLLCISALGPLFSTYQSYFKNPEKILRPKAENSLFTGWKEYFSNREYYSEYEKAVHWHDNAYFSLGVLSGLICSVAAPLSIIPETKPFGMYLYCIGLSFSVAQFFHPKYSAKKLKAIKEKEDALQVEPTLLEMINEAK